MNANIIITLAGCAALVIAAAALILSSGPDRETEEVFRDWSESDGGYGDYDPSARQ